jgi:hypothetical protein
VIATRQQADLIAGLAGLVLLISMFLPWFGPSTATERAFERADEVLRQTGGEPVERPDLTQNAWQAFTFVKYVLLLTGLVGILAGIATLARPRGRPPVAPTAVTVGLGVVSSLLILHRVINPIGEAGREYGLFLALIGAAGIALGGWLALERETEPEPGSRGGAPADSIGSRSDE